jgi:hypothetical protein
VHVKPSMRRSMYHLREGDNLRPEYPKTMGKARRNGKSPILLPSSQFHNGDRLYDMINSTGIYSHDRAFSIEEMNITWSPPD